MKTPREWMHVVVLYLLFRNNSDNIEKKLNIVKRRRRDSFCRIFKKKCPMR